MERARYHADKALTMHDSLFGGGKERFLRRYREEFIDPPLKRNMSEAQLLYGLEELWDFGGLWEAIAPPGGEE